MEEKNTDNVIKIEYEIERQDDRQKEAQNNQVGGSDRENKKRNRKKETMKKFHPRHSRHGETADWLSLIPPHSSGCWANSRHDRVSTVSEKNADPTRVQRRTIRSRITGRADTDGRMIRGDSTQPEERETHSTACNHTAAKHSSANALKLNQSIRQSNSIYSPLQKY